MQELQESASAIQVPDAVTPLPYVPLEFGFILDKDLYEIDAGGSVTVHYTLSSASSVEAVTKCGWRASVNYTGEGEGKIVITAPDPASYAEVTLIATTEDGRRTAVILPVMLRDPFTAATRPRMTAVGYYSFKPWNASEDNFVKLAEAGLTMVTVETGDEDYEKSLVGARKAGLEVLAIVGDDAAKWYDDMSYTGLDELITSLKDSTVIYEWWIRDEPSVDNIYELMAIEDKMKSLDPNRSVYVNLHPNASSNSLGVDNYYDYVNIYATHMHLSHLSFDMYPILKNGGVQTDWHYCLETVANVAKQHGVPFWAFAASCWINKEPNIKLERAQPNVDNLLLQIYTDLAYGAQAVQYFTIQDYGGTDYAPIMRDGTWTKAYDDLETANLTMQKRAFVFKDGNVTRIRQVGTSASHESALSILDFPPAIKSVDVTFAATVSFIENNGNEYMVIVNNYWSADQNVRVELDSPVYSIDSEGQFHLLEPGVNNVWLAKGDIVVLKYR